MRELAACGDDLRLRHGDGAAVRAPQRRQHFAAPDRLGDRGPLRNRRLRGDRRAGRVAARESFRDRRAILRLDGEQPRQARDLAPAQQFAEADVAAEHVAAGARRYENVVRRAEAEILPEFIGERLRPLQEERLPIVARIEDRARLPYRLVGRVLARARDEFGLGAIGAHLYGLGGLGIGGHEDFRGHSAGRRISRDRRAAVAGTVLEHFGGRPAARNAEIITVAPRSLKLPVGENHSSLNRARAPSQRRSTSGVRPSPIVTGSSIANGSAAA